MLLTDIAMYNLVIVLKTASSIAPVSVVAAIRPFRYLPLPECMHRNPMDTPTTTNYGKIYSAPIIGTLQKAGYTGQANTICYFA